MKELIRKLKAIVISELTIVKESNQHLNLEAVIENSVNELVEAYPGYKTALNISNDELIALLIAAKECDC